jgi:hypothetical protein
VSRDLGWLEMEWLESGYQAVLDAALDSENWDLIRDVGYFSIRAAGLAVRHGDYYVFHRFLKWLPYMYDRSQAMADQRTKGTVAERCGRYLQESISFLVAPFFTEPDIGPPMGTLGDYVLGIENVFGDLMKQAVDYDEPRDYCHFSRQLALGLESLRYSLPDADQSELTWRLSLRTSQQLFAMHWNGNSKRCKRSMESDADSRPLPACSPSRPLLG